MNDTSDAASIFAPLWRRKWLILAVAVVVGLGSYLYYKHQRPTFQSSTQLYLGAAGEEATPGEKASTKASGASVSNAVSVIDSIVVEGVRQRLRAEHRGDLAHEVTVRAKEKGEFITITTEAHSGRTAALVANLVAQDYIKRQRATHTRVIERAIDVTRRQLRRIEAADLTRIVASKGKGSSSSQSTASILQQANLNSKINQLEASLDVAGPEQVKPAKAANSLQVAPKPRKNAIFGFVLGFVLAAIAAYILSRFDRRLRSLAAVEEAFQARILTALPRVRRPIVSLEGLPAPAHVLLEPLRRLHTSLRLNDGEETGAGTSPSILLVMSAEAGDGKSTLVADLALVKRDAGERVAVVEADFRHPVQAGLLGLDQAPGLADVLAGTLALEDALHRVLPLDQALHADVEGDGGLATAVQARAGSLFLLAGAGSVSNPPATLAQPAMRDLLRSLAADFDHVLVDVPSPLEVSDAMPLLKEVDGIVIVARIGHTRETSARRLVQLLTHTPSAPVLGVAANCATARDMDRYGFASPNGRGWLGRPRGR